MKFPHNKFFKKEVGPLSLPIVKPKGYNQTLLSQLQPRKSAAVEIYSSMILHIPHKALVFVQPRNSDWTEHLSPQNI